MSQQVVVIGGGLVGCLCALRLADEGATVTVLEKSVPGAEASSAAAGILAAQAESREDGPLFSLAMSSREQYAAIADELRSRVGADIGYVRCGIIETARDEGELDALYNKLQWQRAQGLSVERLDAVQLHKLEPQLASTFVGGVYFENDAQVDPPRLVQAVAQAAERAGVRFRSGAYVRRVMVVDGHATGVELDDGTTVPADHVVVAAGAWSALVEGAQLPQGSVRPARGQIAELQTRTPPLRAVVYGAGGYVVPRADGRVLCGSTLEFVGFRNEVTVGGVRKVLDTAMSLVPSLEHAKLSRTWANFRPHTADGAPLIGDVGVQSLTVATGHYRSGILMAPITATLVRDRVLGRAARAESSAVSPTRASRS